jgi:uncharacterized protein YbjT (DUF2867 family)
MSDRVILLTGATGYVGGRLLGALEARGERLRCLARRPEYLRPRVAESTEVVPGDVLDAPSLPDAVRGIDTAYYLIHSMGDSGDFAAREHTGARNFSRAALAAGVRRIIYLGGLGGGGDLSEHLRSRQDVGEILRESGVPTIELRASIIIGSGSLSFEMIRALVNKLPVMVTPRWVGTPAQPIAIEDVLAYLIEALDVNAAGSAVFEIGGADQVSYREIMQEYARQRGLRRIMVPVPVLSPRLSSLWLGLVTPLFARVGRKLIDGVRNPTVVTDDSALHRFEVRPRGVHDAIARALVHEDRAFAETRWSDALSSQGETPGWGGVRFGSRLVDSRTLHVPRPPPVAFRPVRAIGGSAGWYYGNWLWRLRGFLDLLVGGVGTRRGRRNPEHIIPGDTVDFWRVEAFEPDRLLRLFAEMRLPGRAWLQFEVEPEGDGSRLRQTAVFDPVGLFGLAYWYALYPLHTLVFAGMIRGIARAAEAGSPPRPAAPGGTRASSLPGFDPPAAALADDVAGSAISGQDR